MDINFIGPITLIKQLIPIIQKNNSPTLINITSGLIYVPRSGYLSCPEIWLQVKIELS